MIPAKVVLGYETETRGSLKGTLGPRIYDIVREMPGRRKWKDGVLYFELTGLNIKYLWEQLPDAEWLPMLCIRRDELLRKEKVEGEIAKERNVKVDLSRAKEFPFKTDPYEHQLRAFLLSKDAEYFGYFMEMGTGKSKTIIDKAFYSYCAGFIDTMVIIAPNGVHAQWIKEQIPTHAWDSVSYEAAIFRSGMDFKTKTLMDLTLKARDKFRIISINVEAFSHGTATKFLESILLSSKTLVVIDESSRIKDQSSTRTKTLLKMRKYMTQRAILTGTPITQGVEDLYSQLNFLSEDILGIPSFYAFRNRYCVLSEGRNPQSGKTYHKVVGYKNMEELQKKLDGNSFRILKEECLDLPEKVFKNHYVEMTEDQKKHYTTMKKHLITQIDTGEIVEGAIAITNLMRLQQILCGHLPSSETVGGVIEIPNNRVQACIDNILDANGKVLVWSRFINDVQQISKALDKLEIGYVTYTGSTTQKAREEGLERFKQDPNCRVFIGNPATAGIGLNLTVANYVIWYSMSYSLEEYLQANDRVHRIGQTNRVTYIHLMCEGTIDEKVQKTLQKKQLVATTMLDIREMII